MDFLMLFVTVSFLVSARSYFKTLCTGFGFILPLSLTSKIYFSFSSSCLSPLSCCTSLQPWVGPRNVWFIGDVCVILIVSYLKIRWTGSGFILSPKAELSEVFFLLLLRLVFLFWNPEAAQEMCDFSVFCHWLSVCLSLVTSLCCYLKALCNWI